VSWEELAALVTAVAVLLGAIGQVWGQSRATHRLVNSRMDELLRLTRSSSIAEGKESERVSSEAKATGLGGRWTFRPSQPAEKTKEQSGS
jgi:hypothetical protein